MSQKKDSQQQSLQGQNQFELDIDLYFWIIDVADLVDDQRNQVEVEKQRVKLFREQSQLLVNGFYIGKIMVAIRKTIIKKTKKPFTLDPVLNNLKVQSIQSAKEYNWNCVFVELRKFNIKVQNDQKNQVIKENSHRAITQILRSLFEYDQNLQAFKSTDQQIIEQNNIILNKAFDINKQSQDSYGIQSSPKKQKKNDNNSEINFGYTQKQEDVIERSYPRKQKAVGQKADSQINQKEENYQNEVLDIENQEDRSPERKAFGHKNSENIYQKKADFMNQKTPEKGKMTNQKSATTLNQKKKADLQSQETVSKSQKFKEDHDQSYASVIEENEIYGIEEEDNEQNQMQAQEQDLEMMQETDSPALFIILSLKASLKMQDNQVATLLLYNNKYLIQACVKGQKISKFKNINAWYQLLNNNVGKLIFILKKENNNQIRKTLNIIKSGLFSQNYEVANNCCRFFSKFRVILNENPQNTSIQDLKFGFWDWLTLKQPIEDSQTNQTSITKKNSKSDTQSPQKIGNKDLNIFLQEQGLKAFMHSHKRHGVNFIQVFCAFLIQVGEHNYQELFMNNLRNSCENIKQFLTLIHDIHEIICQTSNGKKAFIDSGLYISVIDMCIEINSDPQYQEKYSQNDLNVIQLSLTLMTDIWKTKVTKYSNKNPSDKKLTESMLFILKRTSRDKPRTTSLISISLLTSLLDQFAAEKNEYAPKIYKVLTFLLIDCYYNEEMRIEILNNFVYLFKKHPSIPIQIMCTPYFKQIQLDLDRVYHNNQNNILQREYERMEMNQMDFDLLYQICAHPKLTQNIACQMIDIVSEISQQNLVYTRTSLNILYQLLQIFENNMEVYLCIQNQIDKAMILFESQDKIKCEMYKLVIKSPKTKVYAKKKYSLALKREVNQSMEQPQFNTISNRNSLNIKFKAAAEKQAQYTNQSIDFDDTKRMSQAESGLGTLELIFDKDLQNALDPNIFQLEAAQYKQLITREKMIVNFLKMFIISGIQVLQKYIMNQCVSTYVKIAKQQSFQNKGLVYLMSLIDQDWRNLVAMSNSKIKTVQRKKDSIKKSKIFNGDLESAISNQKNGLYDTYIEQDTQPNSQSNNPRRNIGDPVYLPSMKIREDSIEKLKLYDLNERIQSGVCPEEELNKNQMIVQNYNKLIRAMFNKYSAISSNKMATVNLTFEDLKNQQKRMNLHELYAFLNDFKLHQNLSWIKRDDFKRFIRAINLRQINNIGHKAELDIKGFIDFIQNLAFFFSEQRIQRPSIFLPIFWDYLKQISFQSDLPLFQRLFHDPLFSQFGDQQLISELTKKVREDQNYPLPPGFIKYRQPILFKEYRAPNHLGQSWRISMEILDEILFDNLGIHSLHQEIDGQYDWFVKFDTHQKIAKKQIQPSYMKIDKRHQFNSIVDDFESTNDIKSSKVNGYTPVISSNKFQSIGRQNSQNSVSQSDAKFKIQKQNHIPIHAQNMSASLKLQLLENINSPQIDILSETAQILEDMIRTVEKGKRQFTPQTKARIYQQKPKKTQKNQAELKKIELEQQEKFEKAKKEQSLQKRKTELGQIIQRQKHESLLNQAQKDEERRREREEMRRMEDKKSYQKQKFYDKIKQNYKQNQLPVVIEEQRREEEKEEMDKRRRRTEKILANEKIQKDVQNMREIFEMKHKNDQEKEINRVRDEAVKKQKLDMKNDRLAQSLNTRLQLKRNDEYTPNNGNSSQNIMQSGKTMNGYSNMMTPIKNNANFSDRQRNQTQPKAQQLQSNNKLDQSLQNDNKSRKPPVYQQNTLNQHNNQNGQNPQQNILNNNDSKPQLNNTVNQPQQQKKGFLSLFGF